MQPYISPNETRRRRASSPMPGRSTAAAESIPPGAFSEASDEAHVAAAQFDLLLETLPVGVIVLDLDDRVARCNAAAERMIGFPPFGMTWPTVVERIADRDTSAGGELRTRHGRRLSIMQSVAHRSAGRVILLADVTETRTLEALARRNQRLSSMGRMAASLAHQVRTPLASALLYFSQCRAELPLERLNELLERGMARLHDINRLVADILVFARGAGPGERVRIADILREVHSGVLGVLPVGAHFVVMGDDALLEIHGNRVALVAALTNLVRNALEAAPNGIVTLRTKLCGDDVEFSVSDNGPGIAPSLRSRVLEPFFSTRSGGTGLGLAVAKAVAEAHGGRLALESELERGTTVEMRLPRDGVLDVAVPAATALQGVHR